MNKQIQCVICGREFRPRHWHTICCYDSECREIYKEQQRVAACKKMSQWRERVPKKVKCKSIGCKSRVLRGGYYCKACVSRFSDLFADIGQTEEGCRPSEMTLWLSDTPRMIYR